MLNDIVGTQLAKFRLWEIFYGISPAHCYCKERERKKPLVVDPLIWLWALSGLQLCLTTLSA